MGILYLISPEESEVLEQEGILHVLERKILPFVKDHLVAKIVLYFKWSVLHGLCSLPHT